MGDNEDKGEVLPVIDFSAADPDPESDQKQILPVSFSDGITNGEIKKLYQDSGVTNWNDFLDSLNGSDDKKIQSIGKMISEMSRSMREIFEDIKKHLPSNATLEKAEGVIEEITENEELIEKILQEMPGYEETSLRDILDTIPHFAIYSIADPSFHFHGVYGQPVADAKRTRQHIEAIRKALEAARRYRQFAGFYNVPTSTAANLITETLIANEDFDFFFGTKRKTSRNKYSISRQPKKTTAVQISEKTRKAEITIEIEDVNNLSTPAKKFFALIAIKAAEQVLTPSAKNSDLRRNYVSFSLQDLVDIGFYSNRDSARKGFKKGIETLSTIKIRGSENVTNKRTIKQESMRVLFTGYDIKRGGNCTVFFNQDMNWNFIFRFFTILPRYYFKLSSRASDLLFYVFYLARQNVRKIAEQGYFTIGFRNIQQRLMLPLETETAQARRDTIEVIDKIIEEIEEEHASLYNDTGLSFLPVYNESDSISKILDTGYLKVSLSDQYAQPFLEMNQKTVERVATARKRIERIETQAKAINMAKNLQENNE